MMHSALSVSSLQRYENHSGFLEDLRVNFWHSSRNSVGFAEEQGVGILGPTRIHLEIY